MSVKDKPQLALMGTKSSNQAISYDVIAQLYADLRTVHERLQIAEARLRLQRENNESLKSQLAAARLSLQKMTANFVGMKAREKNWKKEKDLIEKRRTEEVGSLQQKIQKIQNFNSYKLGRSIVESEKKWGKIFGGFIGHYKYHSQCRRERKAEREKEVRNRSQQELLEQLNAAALKEEDLVFQKPQGSRLRIAAIMDDFTRECFAPDCELVDLHPEQWEKQLNGFGPDLVFIESAWQGREEAWKTHVSNFSSTLKKLIGHCRKRRIPVMFWNKEDPPHYNTFLPLAKAVDFVFTTDFDRISHYKRAVGHNRVYLLPFAAQPRMHNPIETYERQPGFCFAGSYYLRYPERQRDFASIMTAILSVSTIEIYDRNFGKDHPHYMFPEQYREYIVGTLPYSEISRAYKGYEFGVNMNSIKQSQTMFARRVYELAASNTLVLSNFSRGLRNFFGDLVISSDNEQELKKRILPFLENPSLYRRQRLAALRHVFSCHTYADRLNYIREKIWKSSAENPVSILMVANCTSREEAERVMESFARQSWENRELLVTGMEKPEDWEEIKRIHWLPDANETEKYITASDAAFIGFFSPEHFYGENYLTDLALASRYSNAEAFGKSARYIWNENGLLLTGDGAQYRLEGTFPFYAGIARKNLHLKLKANSEAPLQVIRGLALDEFNFVENGGTADPAGFAEALDLVIPDVGIPYKKRILALAEGLDQAEEKANTMNFQNLPSLSAKDLQKLFKGTGQVRLSLKDNSLYIRSTLSENRHVYLHGSVFSRDSINLRLNSTVSIQAEGDLKLKVAFIFLDKEQNKISHSMVKPGVNVLAIPIECEYVQISLRIEGKGEEKIKRVVFGRAGDDPDTILCRGNTLLVAKQYPAYDDLYKYGFLHSRLRKYREEGRKFDMIRIRHEDAGFSEFEDIDIATCNHDTLDRTLKSGQIKTVAVHLIDRQIWEVVKKYLEQIKVVIWIHGAEIQHWKRREFEFASMTDAEIEYAKKRSDDFMTLWREIFASACANLEFVIVSNTFKKECEDDIGLEFPENSCHVIHNFIDGQIFPYKEKSPDQRFNVISIRPYYTLTYANDLTVKAILELSTREDFDRYSFTIIGDGPLFDETVEPLRDFENVTIEKGFLTHSEMERKYRQNGVLLCPTRSDTQGVSRDEAMSCGLVPITNKVASVPEFVDDSCGILVPGEDYLALADALERLAEDGQTFMELSRKATERVVSLSGYDETISRETRILF